MSMSTKDYWDSELEFNKSINKMFDISKEVSEEELNEYMELAESFDWHKKISF